jgi:hypothetical protein
LIEHDLFGKPVANFSDHARVQCWNRKCAIASTNDDGLEDVTTGTRFRGEARRSNQRPKPPTIAADRSLDRQA